MSDSPDSSYDGEDGRFVPVVGRSFVQRAWLHFKIFLVFLYKTLLTFRRRWVYIFGPAALILLISSTSVLLLRKSHPWQRLETEALDDTQYTISNDWVHGSFAGMNGVVLVGFAPRYSFIEALMEEAERILVRNGLPPGVTEFQVVPFQSEYTMSRFIRTQPGVLRYAFALDASSASNTELEKTLHLFSYINDKGNRDKENSTQPRTGDVYIAKVIMEAFINAHTGNENNITIQYQMSEANPKRRDTMLSWHGKTGLEEAFIVCIAIIIWTIVYHISLERECQVQVILSRMGVSDTLNGTAMLTVWFPYLLLLLMLMGLLLVEPLMGEPPVVSESDSAPVLVFIGCYALSLLAYCALGSTLFNTAQLCVMLSCFLFAVTVYLDDNWDPPEYLRFCLCFVTVGSQKGIGVILSLEEHAQGLHWDNIHLVAKGKPQGLPISWQMALLLVSVPLQLLAALAIIHLKKTDRRTWLKKRHDESEEIKQDLTNYQKPPVSGIPCVVLKNVYTNGRVPLYDINLQINEDEISVTMGLENSGRLAILSVLYGETPPVSGKVTVFGLDITQYSKEIRSNCGTCSTKRRSLFYNLTVQDNLWIFYRLKCISQQRQLPNIYALLESAELEHVQDTVVSRLTVDDMAVLNVALAFLGDSKLVLLEDPTKDMSILTKMRIWNLIRQHSKDRSVVISTMSMEEAQLIGDRITIFTNGHIYCSGSVPYLQTIFGTGYYLTIQKKSTAPPEAVKLMCSHYCPDSECIEEKPTKMVFLLPTNDGSTFMKNLLESLEKHQAKLGILNYDVEGSTLVHDFISFISREEKASAIGDTECKKPNERCKLALKKRYGIGIQSQSGHEITKPTDNDTRKETSQAILPDKPSEKEDEETYCGSITSINDTGLDTTELKCEEEILRRKGVWLYLHKLLTLTDARFLTSSRTLHIDIGQAFLVAILVMYYLVGEHRSYMSGEVRVDHWREPERFCPSFEALGVRGGSDTLRKSPRTKKLLETLEKVHRVRKLKCRHAIVAKRDKDMHELLKQQTKIEGLPHYGIELVPSKNNSVHSLIYATHVNHIKSLVPAMCATMEAYLKYATNDTKDEYKITYHNVYEPPSDYHRIESTKFGTTLVIVFMFVPYNLIKRRMTCSTKIHQLSGAGTVANWVANFISDIVSYCFLASAYFIAIQVNDPRIPYFVSEVEVITVIVLYGAMLLFYIYWVQMYFSNPLLGTAFIMVIFFVTSEAILRYHIFDSLVPQIDTPHIDWWYFVFPAFLMPAYMHLTDHNNHVKYHCPSSVKRPCHIEAYQDICCSSLMKLIELSPLKIIVIGVAHLIFGMTVLLITEYRVYKKPIRWLRNKMNKKEQEVTYIRQTSFTKRRGSEDNDNELACRTKSNAAVLFSSFLTSATASTASKPPSEVEVAKSASALGQNVLALPTQLPEQKVSTNIDVQKDESNKLQPGFEPVKSATEVRVSHKTSSAVEVPKNDDRVVQESGVVSNVDLFLRTSTDDPSGMSFKKLTKKQLLKNINLNINSGEIFCFVSAQSNTTTELINCICGWSSYDGQILLNGEPFGMENPKSPVTVGLCPREEPVIGTLSIRESLTFYCKMRGVIDYNKEVKEILKLLKLGSFANADPREMSECALVRFRVAKAVVGEPDIILLDHPLTSLDTSSRLTVLGAISRLKRRGKMVILTSNSIDQCADIASRVAIIVRGELVFAAAPQVIRSRFSNSYSLSARIDSRDKMMIDILIPSLLQRFPDSQIFVDSLNYLQILLPFKTDSLADIFRLMESVNKHLKTSDFVLRHATMDTIINVLEQKGKCKEAEAESKSRKRFCCI